MPEVTRPCLCAKYLPLSEPLHRAGVGEEDAEMQLSRNGQAGATRAAHGRVCRRARGLCTYRNVTVCIVERIMTVFLQCHDTKKKREEIFLGRNQMNEALTSNGL